MTDSNSSTKMKRCAYINVCFIAEELKCLGFKTNCPLYKKSNGIFLDEKDFNLAMDELIDKTKLKYEKHSG